MTISVRGVSTDNLSQRREPGFPNGASSSYSVTYNAHHGSSSMGTETKFVEMNALVGRCKLDPGLKAPLVSKVQPNEDKTCFQFETLLLRLRHYALDLEDAR